MSVYFKFFLEQSTVESYRKLSVGAGLTTWQGTSRATQKQRTDCTYNICRPDDSLRIKNNWQPAAFSECRSLLANKDAIAIAAALGARRIF